MPDPSKPVLKLSGIGKSFGATRVLHDVDFDLRAGEVHVLAGENGAGKSTLIKILAGIHHDYDGMIELHGSAVRFVSPAAASRHGVAVIHQELSLVESMSIADNLQLGREAARGAGWWLNRRTSMGRAVAACRELGLNLSEADLARPAGEFPVAVKHQIEIAKALTGDVRVLLLDEPTSALHHGEVERLFRLIGCLKTRGVGVIYISHKMDEIYRIADRITVLRDGRRIGCGDRTTCPPATLVQWMIGRELSHHNRSRSVGSASAPVALTVTDLRVPHRDPRRPDLVRGVSFTVRAGEVVGLAGLQGCGASELLRALFGEAGGVTGTMGLGGDPYRPSSPREAIARGLALLTADRKATGLVPTISVERNITLAALPRFSRGGFLQRSVERGAARRQAAALGVRCASLAQSISSLSGGNQQKALLARWRETGPRVLLLDEPTRGVDIGAKHEIYERIREWVAPGMAVLMASTEMSELLALCDRVLVLHRGELAAEFASEGVTAEKILIAAMGEQPQSDPPFA